MTTGPRQAARSVAGAVLALVLLLTAASCRSSDSSDAASAPATTEAPRNGGGLVMAVDAETDGWNPQTSQWSNAGYWVGGSVLEPLVTFDEKGAAVMWLAESVTPKVPGKFDAWLIKVRQGIQFSNGQPFDAAAVKKNLDVLLGDASISSIVQKGFYKSFTVLDDRTVEADLGISWASFPANLGGPIGLMMANEMLDAPFGGLNHPIGTGPFVFQSWVPHESFKATRNPKYWRPGEPHLDSIEFRPMPDNKKALAALQNGDIDMMVTTKAEDINLATGFDAKRDFHTEKTMTLVSVEQNPTRPPNPFVNRHARLALAYGTDRAAIRELVGGGQELQTSTQPMVAGAQWAVPEDQTGYYPFDQAKAKAEVDAYRQETGAADLSFELTTTTSPDNLAIAQKLVDQWKAVGANVTVHSVDALDIVGLTVFGNFDAIVYHNYGYLDPDNNQAFWQSSNANGPGKLSINFSQLKDPDIDAALADARQTDDIARQRTDYLTVTKKLNEHAVNLWLYDTPYSVIYNRSVRGLEVLDVHSFGDYMPKPWLWGGVWRD